MFKMNGYRIVETKEEFEKEWKPSWRRYDGFEMPGGFSLEKATFPMALHHNYNADYDPYSCGSWSYAPLEMAIVEITKAYEEEIEYFTKRIQQIKKIKD